MKATEQYFPVVLFILQYKVVVIFESENKPWSDQIKAIKEYIPEHCTDCFPICFTFFNF